MLPDSIAKKWFKPVSSFPLEVFRFLLGLSLLAFFIRWYFSGRFEAFYIKPDFHFSYDWLPQLPTLSEGQSYFLLVLLILSSLAIVLRWWVKWAALLILLCFGYFFFLEKALYNNHYYFILLLSGWLFVVYDGKKRATFIRPELIPAWKLWAFRLQVITVYFFGGIAKSHI